MAQREPGNYHGTLVRAITTEIGRNNTKAIVLTFMINHKAVNGGWEPDPAPNEREVTIWVSQKALDEGPARAQLASLGFNGNYGAPEFDASLKTEGTELVCEQDGRFERFSLPDNGGKERKPLSDDEIAVLNADWKNYTAANAVPAGKPHVPPGADQDDVPF